MKKTRRESWPEVCYGFVIGTKDPQTSLLRKLDVGSTDTGAGDVFPMKPRSRCHRGIEKESLRRIRAGASRALPLSYLPKKSGERDSNPRPRRGKRSISQHHCRSDKESTHPCRGSHPVCLVESEVAYSWLTGTNRIQLERAAWRACTSCASGWMARFTLPQPCPQRDSHPH